MSYLDIPRIHFGGRFFTDPSTVNNDPTHYNSDVTEPSPWQTPSGQHRFEFRDCLITSAMGPSGFSTDDTIIGCPLASIVSANVPAPRDHSAPRQSAAASSARIVDLDVYQQAVSEIYGLQLTLTVGGVPITGQLDTPALNMCWIFAVRPTRSWTDEDYDQDSFGGDMNATGVFQCVMKVPVANWPQTSSTLLNLLRTTTIQENNFYLISIKFVVDGFRNVQEDVDYLTGRIVGTLGPVFANEPRNNPGQRWLRPRSFKKSDPWNWPSFNDCPFKVDTVRQKLIIDLANSFCRQSAGGPPVDIGTVNITVETPDPAILQLGTLDYSAFSYANNAQVNEIPLTAVQVETLQKGKLVLSMSKTGLGDPGILIESTNKVEFCIEKRPIRMEGIPGTKATTQVYISQNGKPLPNYQLKVLVESVHGNTPGATVPPANPGDTPSADGALLGTITASDQYGFATITLTVASDPGFRTSELDGQLYFIIPFDPAQPPRDYSVNPPPLQDRMASCLVFSNYAVNTTPTWEEIQSMMAPYMKLYPSMKEQVDLTDQHTFDIFSDNPPWVAYGKPPNYSGPLGIARGAIPYYMSRDPQDPMYMPISRDLSPAKMLTLMYYIQSVQKQLDAKKTTT